MGKSGAAVDANWVSGCDASGARGVYNHDKVSAFRGVKIVVNNLLYSETWVVNVRCASKRLARALSRW